MCKSYIHDSDSWTCWVIHSNREHIVMFWYLLSSLSLRWIILHFIHPQNGTKQNHNWFVRNDILCNYSECGTRDAFCGRRDFDELTESFYCVFKSKLVFSTRTTAHSIDLIGTYASLLQTNHRRNGFFFWRKRELFQKFQIKMLCNESYQQSACFIALRFHSACQFDGTNSCWRLILRRLQNIMVNNNTHIIEIINHKCTAAPADMERQQQKCRCE